MSEPIKAVTYSRVSTNGPEDCSDRQQAQAEAYARRQGYNLVEHYQDAGVPGHEAEARPATQG
jgi:DNA invertase Pin-like site-specific DNA recombinase